MILEKTVKVLEQIYNYHKIVLPRHTNVVIGLGYTAVEVASFTHGKFLGLAYTLQELIKSSGCTKIHSAGSLVDKPLEELLHWTYGSPSLQKIIGVATLNAASQYVLTIKNPYHNLEEPLEEYFKIKGDTRITFIGQINPLIRQFSKITKEITIIERKKHISESFLKFNCKHDITELKESEIETDVLICTGTTLVNDTLEDILKLYRKNARYIALIGPSASMIPDILFDYGVDLVGGMTITDTEPVLRIIQEAGGTKLFKQYGKKYNLVKDQD
ncbi:MAG: hypothetical protein EU535_08540 [Promethearchaeota archaeon]|nr:MAG: hypothetical protein EU535_08540 [Candidatus Lokiarchaeota archaeon]